MALKISQLTAATQANLTDLLETSQSDGMGGWLSKKLTLQQAKTLVVGGIRTLTDANTTLQLADQNGTIVFDGSSQAELTILTNSDVPIPIGAVVRVINSGLSVTILADGGVTLVGGTIVFSGSNTAAYIQQTAEDIWELLNPADLSFWSGINFTSTSKDLAYSDQFNKQIYTGATDTTITIKPFLSVALQQGATIYYKQGSTGKITFAAGVGVTIKSNASPSALWTTNAGDEASLTHTDTNTWTLNILSGMGAQPASDVAITGGTINGTSFGDSIPSTGRVTALSITQPVGFSGSSSVRQVAGVQTTNATPTVLVSILLNESESITLSGTIIGAQSNHSNAVGGTFSITARRASGGNVTLIGSVVTNVESSSAATFTCAVDTGTQTVRVLVTGVAATTYNWAANYTYQLVLTNL
jgi:hypothetical protein